MRLDKNVNPHFSILPILKVFSLDMCYKWVTARSHLGCVVWIVFTKLSNCDICPSLSKAHGGPCACSCKIIGVYSYLTCRVWVRPIYNAPNVHTTISGLLLREAKDGNVSGQVVVCGSLRPNSNWTRCPNDVLNAQIMMTSLVVGLTQDCQ